MPHDEKSLLAANAAGPALPLQAARAAELPVELAQFAETMRRVRHRVGFDQDPSDFRRNLGS